VRIEPFRIAISDAELRDLRERLGRTRFPEEIPGSGWGYGTALAYMRELVAYWREEYDWRAAEAKLNAFPQFRAEVGGLGIHFIHRRGRGPAPLPLVLSHGWPGSIAEFAKVIGPLADPEAHGGDAADAFDVVCPSIPGFGFSDHPRAPGVTPERVAALWVELMNGLGYRRFGAQGGDWGGIITTYMGIGHAASLAGIHLNMVLAFPLDPARPEAGLSGEELAAVRELQRFRRDESGYQAIQGTKPQTLAYGLTDSPAGLAAWIVEKFRTWSDCGGEIERRFSKDELLTNVMLYWLPANAGSSGRLYCEALRSGRFPPPDFRVAVPTGCAIFPREILRPPRAWVERYYNLMRWTPMSAGGHFAAMEEPAALVDEIRAFFRPLRDAADRRNRARCRRGMDD
jgi:microsomal epoxide hydrolase